MCCSLLARNGTVCLAPAVGPLEVLANVNSIENEHTTRRQSLLSWIFLFSFSFSFLYFRLGMSIQIVINENTRPILARESVAHYLPCRVDFNGKANVGQFFAVEQDAHSPDSEFPQPPAPCPLPSGQHQASLTD